MRERIWTTTLGLGLLLQGAALAQNAPSGPSDGYNASGAPADPASTQQTFSKEQIAQLAAPLALYPDSLLTQILMASTYPLEVVQADRFAKANSSLKGDELAKQLEQQPWDPSVKSLVNFPQVLSMMSDQLDTTVQLGNAFLAQQQDVLAAVQDLRGRAKQAGTLKSNGEINVTDQPLDSGTAAVGGGAVDNGPDISIAPTADNLNYVPDYDPTTIYGAWPYPNYQPYPYYPNGYGVGGLVWGSGILYGDPWGYAWGSPNWRHRWIDYDFHRNDRWNHFIDRDRYHDHWEHYREARNFDDNHWAHDARHRDGVPYPDARDAERFRQRSVQDERARDAFRGRDDRGNGNSLGIRGNNSNNNTGRDDREVTVTRDRTPNETPNVRDRNNTRVDNDRNNDRAETIRRDQQTTVDRRQADADAERRSARSGDPQPVDRGNLGDVNRTQAEERAAAHRGRESRQPSITPRAQGPAETPTGRSGGAPVRSEPTPTRSEPSPAPSAPRIASPSPRVDSPSAPSGGGRNAGPSGGGGGGGGRDGRR